jgi:hypothetical protein
MVARLLRRASIELLYTFPIARPGIKYQRMVALDWGDRLTNIVKQRTVIPDSEKVYWLTGRHMKSWECILVVIPVWMINCTILMRCIWVLFINVFLRCFQSCHDTRVRTPRKMSDSSRLTIMDIERTMLRSHKTFKGPHNLKYCSISVGPLRRMEKNTSWNPILQRPCGSSSSAMDRPLPGIADRCILHVQPIILLINWPIEHCETRQQNVQKLYPSPARWE